MLSREFSEVSVADCRLCSGSISSLTDANLTVCGRGLSEDCVPDDGCAEFWTTLGGVVPGTEIASWVS